MNSILSEDITSLIYHYDNTKEAQATFDIGQIVFTPVINTDPKLQIAEIDRSNPYTHKSISFNIRGIAEADFKGKPNRLPIAALHLSQEEEIVVSRAKKRPCIILAKTEGINVDTLPAGAQRNKARNAFACSYLLAPIYSSTTADKARSFGPVMVARIKCLMYPEFVFLPPSGLIIRNESIIRLDRLFWSHLLGATASENLFVSTDLLGLCWSQIGQLSGQSASEKYGELRDLLLSYLPEELLASTY